MPSIHNTHQAKHDAILAQKPFLDKSRDPRLRAKRLQSAEKVQQKQVLSQEDVASIRLGALKNFNTFGFEEEERDRFLKSFREMDPKTVATLVAFCRLPAKGFAVTMRMTHISVGMPTEEDKKTREWYMRAMEDNEAINALTAKIYEENGYDINDFFPQTEIEDDAATDCTDEDERMEWEKTPTKVVFNKNNGMMEMDM